MVSTKKNKQIIACRSLQPELDWLLSRSGNRDISVIYLDQALHRTPDRMPGVIQEAVDRVEPSVSTVVLGYGLCANGVVGVKAPAQGLIIPRVHDCIALFLGTREAYLKAFKKNPGAYYLTPGWVAEQKDPLGFMENDYIPRVGREEAIWAAKEELKHYTHIILIHTETSQDEASLKQRAIANARFFEKRFEERTGTGEYFRKILFGPYDENDFVAVPPGAFVAQKPFLDM